MPSHQNHYCIYYEGCYIKNLSIINRDYKDIIIIDNNPISYAFNKDNGIPIKSWFDDPNDNELIKLLPFLKFLSKANDVRPFIKSAINQKSGQLDFSYINTLQDNANKLKTIIPNKNLNNNNNINLNTGLMNNNVGKNNENKAGLSSNMGLIINNNYINNNNQINKNINIKNINLIDKMNININNNFEKINIIYNNVNNKFNSKTLNQNLLAKTENIDNSTSPNFNKKEKKNIYNKINVEKITHKHLNTQEAKKKAYNVIVKKLTDMNSYKNINDEKSLNNNLKFNKKKSPIYSKYEPRKSYFQDGIEENKKNNENKMIIQRGSYASLQNNNDNYIGQNKSLLLEQQNKNIYKKIKNPKPQNTKLIEDTHAIKEKINNNINENKNLNTELINQKTHTKFKSINFKNIKIDKVNSNIIQNTYYKNINSPNKTTYLRFKTPDGMHYNTSKVNQIKPQILFNDSKQIYSNIYKLTKNEDTSFHKNKIIVMKIIRNNPQKAHFCYSSNKFKKNLTNNSIKDNKNLINKKQKINLKLNKNDKSSGYLYNPFDFILNTKIDKYEKNGNFPSKKIHKISTDNNIIDNNSNLFQKRNKIKILLQ